MLRQESPSPTGPVARLRATPLARAVARAHGVDLAALVGTGPDGRVMARDVRARIPPSAPVVPAPAPLDAPLPPIASPDTAARQQEAARDATGLAQPAMRSAAPVATLTLEFDAGPSLARIAALAEEFARPGLPLDLGIYVAAAVVELLPAHPRLNARWSGDAPALQRQVDLAIADITPEGLRWRVIPGAGDLTLRGLARALAGPPGQGAATFALVSLAAGKSWWSALPPLPGAVAALILGAHERRVVVVGGGLGVRPLATLTLSYDARALDPRQALDFLEALRNRLEHQPV
ncbi:MAG: 2-oxo acid dehydrogenase subunit E2 [Chloroflexaceae bacterium]|nr:2-oxo acid dehydrogenase subunit E2 [Chloroflexaceae bacterium]